MSTQIIPVKYPYQPHHSDILAICCADGRYIRAMGEFLKTQAIDAHDFICLPGGAACLCAESASYAEVMFTADAVDFLIQSHHTRHILLIAHADCGYYKRRFGAADESRQKTDLQRVAERIALRHLQMRISLYFARPATGRESDGFLIESL